MATSPCPSCADLLRDAVAAYQRMVLSGQVVKVKFEDTETAYSPANLSDLLSYIRQLHAVCPSPESALLVGTRSRYAARVTFN
jgi:hypothetical protein